MQLLVGGLVQSFLSVHEALGSISSTVQTVQSDTHTLDQEFKVIPDTERVPGSWGFVRQQTIKQHEDKGGGRRVRARGKGGH